MFKRSLLLSVSLFLAVPCQAATGKTPRETQNPLARAQSPQTPEEAYRKDLFDMNMGMLRNAVAIAEESDPEAQAAMQAAAEAAYAAQRQDLEERMENIQQQSTSINNQQNPTGKKVAKAKKSRTHPASAQPTPSARRPVNSTNNTALFPSSSVGAASSTHPLPPPPHPYQNPLAFETTEQVTRFLQGVLLVQLQERTVNPQSAAAWQDEANTILQKLKSQDFRSVGENLFYLGNKISHTPTTSPQVLQAMTLLSYRAFSLSASVLENFPKPIQAVPANTSTPTTNPAGPPTKRARHSTFQPSTPVPAEARAISDASHAAAQLSDRSAQALSSAMVAAREAVREAASPSSVTPGQPESRKLKRE